MKTRSGFVSNSSSSCFIVAIAPGTETTELFAMADKNYGDSGCPVTADIERMRFSLRYSDWTKEQIDDMMLEIQAYQDKNWLVKLFDIDTHEKEIHKMIWEMSQDKKIDILWSAYNV